MSTAMRIVRSPRTGGRPAPASARSATPLHPAIARGLDDAVEKLGDRERVGRRQRADAVDLPVDQAWPRRRVGRHRRRARRVRDRIDPLLVVTPRLPLADTERLIDPCQGAALDVPRRGVPVSADRLATRRRAVRRLDPLDRVQQLPMGRLAPVPAPGHVRTARRQAWASRKTKSYRCSSVPWTTAAARGRCSTVAILTDARQVLACASPLRRLRVRP